MNARLEHANLSVHDVDGVVRFIRTAFPEFRVRHDGIGPTGVRWVHVGTDETYLALSPAGPDRLRSGAPYQGWPGLNHLAYEVGDVEAVRKRLSEAGFRESASAEAHPHRRRVYFYDPDGNDWEFVQYLTTDPELRHDYAMPDALVGDPPEQSEEHQRGKGANVSLRACRVSVFPNGPAGGADVVARRGGNWFRFRERPVLLLAAL